MLRVIWDTVFGCLVRRPVSELSDDSVMAAVCYWMREVQRGGPGRDTDPEHPMEQTALALSGLCATRPTDRQLLRFFGGLVDEVHRQFQRDRRVVLRSDYGPVDGLENVARRARIDPNCFPFKTTLVIEADGSVRVAPGRRARIRTLYEPGHV